MKYIDADELYKKIDERMAKFAELEKETEPDDMDLSIFYQGKRKMCSEVINLITSLQQEQPKQQNGKFVFPKFLYARTMNNKTIDISYAPQTMEAIEYVRNDFIEPEQPMPNSTELIAKWEEEKDVLKQMDFRGDEWRLAQRKRQTIFFT